MKPVPDTRSTRASNGSHPFERMGLIEAVTTMFMVGVLSTCHTHSREWASLKRIAGLDAPGWFPRHTHSREWASLKRIVSAGVVVGLVLSHPFERMGLIEAGSVRISPAMTPPGHTHSREWASLKHKYVPGPRGDEYESHPFERMGLIEAGTPTGWRTSKDKVTPIRENGPH